MKVFALSGLSECGKSTAGRFFESKGVKKLKIAEFLKKVHKKSGDVSDFANWNFSTESRRPDWLMKRFWEELQEYLERESIPFCSIESLYGPQLAHYLKGELNSNFVIVYIDIPYETRLQRQMIRQNLSTIEEAKAYMDHRDAMKIEQGNLIVKEMANELVYNSGTIDDLYCKLEDVMRRHGVI